MSRVLLDTHVFLWMHAERARLGSLRALIEDETTELFLSPASSWEIAIKWGIGTLTLPEPPETYVPSRMLAAQVQSLPVTHSLTHSHWPQRRCPTITATRSTDSPSLKAASSRFRSRRPTRSSNHMASS